MERFAAAMREARARKKMSQKELSEQCGIATSTISSYESGGKIPPLDIAVKLSKELGLSLDDLFRLEQEAHVDNSFGDVIRHIDHISTSKHTKKVIIIPERTHEQDMRIEIYLQASDTSTGKDWAKEFAPRWNALLSTVAEDPELREMYSAWIEKKINEANICTLEQLPF